MNKNTHVNENTSGMLHNKLGFVATEAYKLLRTNLLFTLPDEKKCKVVGVTSSLRGEGKSTTAINLSYAIAETGKKVLLIDADLRLPSVAKKLEIRSTPGLSNLIVGEVDIKTAINVFDRLASWSMLTAGDVPPNPTEMLGSSQMKKLVEEMENDYEYIIVDLPPVNIVSDAMVISPLLDGMIVVVRENYSERRELSQCIKQLELSGVKLLGIVMNQSNSDNTIYGRYKRSRYYKKLYKYSKDSGYYKKSPYYQGDKK
jgi:capsular exopolysaccharide synthesis family protein